VKGRSEIFASDQNPGHGRANFAKVEEEPVAVPGAEVATTEAEPELAVERGKKEEEEEK
jgi:hypothetical protein